MGDAARRSVGFSTGSRIVMVLLGLAVVGTLVAARISPRVTSSMVAVPAGEAVPAFVIDRTGVTAADYQRCVAAGACEAAVRDPVAYCRWAGKRLPNAAEQAHLAALGGGPAVAGDTGFRCVR